MNEDLFCTICWLASSIIWTLTLHLNFTVWNLIACTMNYVTFFVYFLGMVMREQK